MPTKDKGSIIILIWMLVCVLCTEFTNASTVPTIGSGNINSHVTNSTNSSSGHPHSQNSGTPARSKTTTTAATTTLPTTASSTTQPITNSTVASTLSTTAGTPSSSPSAATTTTTTVSKAKLISTNQGSQTSSPPPTITSSASPWTTNSTVKPHAQQTSSISPGTTNSTVKPHVQQTSSMSPATPTTTTVSSQKSSSTVSDTTTTRVPVPTTNSTTTSPTIQLTSTAVTVKGNVSAASSTSSAVSTLAATTTKSSTNTSSNATSLNATTSTPAGTPTNVPSTTLTSNATFRTTVASMTRNVSTTSNESVHTSSHSITSSATQPPNTSKTNPQPVTQKHNSTGISSSFKPASIVITTAVPQTHAGHNQTRPSSASIPNFSSTGASVSSSSTPTVYTTATNTAITVPSSTTSKNHSSIGSKHTSSVPAITTAPTTTGSHDSSSQSKSSSSKSQTTLSSSSIANYSNNMTSMYATTAQTTQNNSKALSNSTLSAIAKISTAALPGTKSSPASVLGHKTSVSTPTGLSGLSVSSNNTLTVSLNATASVLSTTKASTNSSSVSTPIGKMTNSAKLNHTTPVSKTTGSTALQSTTKTSPGQTQTSKKSSSNATAKLITTTLSGSTVHTTSDTKMASMSVSMKTSHVSSFSYKPDSPRTTRASPVTNPLHTTKFDTATNGSTTQSTTLSTTPDPCNSLACEHGGTCVSHGATANCTCLPGYSGRTCSVDTNECASTPCQHNGTCNDMLNDFNCTCVAGYTGKTCQTNIDDCISNPCQQHGKCNDLVNAYKCTCDPGYTGDTCGTDINECLSNPCQNGATCTDHVAAFNCSCTPGYTGSQCETDIDDCTSKPCENGATCHDLVNAFNCSCVAGFNGTTCHNNINDCVQSNCANGATCVDGINNYTCSCTPGWEGHFCDKDIDECSRGTHGCSKFATCSNKDGGYNCSCNMGFTGDGVTCNDINECANTSLNTCQHGACFNLFGNYSCICGRGWEGNHCQSDIDECTRSNRCDPTAVCKNTNGNYTCDCSQGYRKEGEKCIYKVLLDIPTGFATNTTILHDDDSIMEIHLQQGLAYFGKVFYYAYVSTNGYISLGKRYNVKSPPEATVNWPLDPPIIAPLWTDIDPSANGSGVLITRIRYSDYKREVAENLTDVYGFHATFALVVTWKNVPPYPAEHTYASEQADFQVIIATNGTNTKILYNYDQSHFTWHVSPGRHMTIGYSNKLQKNVSALYSGGDSFLKAKSGSNINVTGRWMFDVSESANATLLAEARCRNVALRTTVINYVSTLGWKYDPCPCTLAQARRDSRFRYRGTNQGIYMFRSTLADIINTRRLCNFNHRGLLETEGQLGGFLDVDLDLGWSMEDIHADCCIHSNLCYLFYQMNPPDTCRYYQPPSFGSGWGDPHIQTLDGKQYTFNGRGEYVLVRTEETEAISKRSLEVQVRTELVSNTSNDSTIFVGLAAQESNSYKSLSGKILVNNTGDIVEVLLNRTSQAVDIFINKIFNTTYRPSTNIDIEGRNFVLYNDSGHLILAFPSGFSLQIDISDILNILGKAATKDSDLANMTGLLGNNDGNADNDLLSRTGILYKAPSTEEQLWDFGTSWMLQNISESLFAYKNPSDFAFYNNPSIKPSTFISEVKNMTNYLFAHCGSTVTEKGINDTCDGNIACRVDMALTCNQQFGNRTRQTQTETIQNGRIAANNPPTIDAPSELFQVRDGDNYTTYISITDDLDPAGKISIELNVSAVFNLTKINATTYFLSWNVNRSQIIDNPPYLRLTATDTMNATSEYWPTIHFCDCAKPLTGICINNFGDAQSSSPVRFMRWTCLCTSGWTGDRCETQLKPCRDTNPCYNSSSCSEVGGEPRCGACPQGLTGDGNKCYDVNECEAVPSPCQQTCTNTRGSYFCGCRSGFQLGADNLSCNDIDECQTTNNCSVAGNEVCVNKVGTYECRCRPGFINVSNSCQQALSQFVGVLTFNVHIGQGNVYTTLKEFLSSVFNRTIALVSVEIHHGNSRMHLRKMKPLFIEKEFILSSDKSTETQMVVDAWGNFTQQDMRCDGDKCELMIGDNGLTVYTDRSRVYTDNDNKLCAIENKRCDDVSTHCISTNGRIACLCRPGFSKIDNLLDRCIDNDECQASPSPCPGGTCINTPGNYTCRCQAGFGYISGKCTDLCFSSPCLNGGVCIHGENENEFICKCDDKWAGQTCERENEEASRLQTAVIAVGASVGGLCFLMLMALLGMCRRNRQKHKAYLHKRAMSSINGYESSKLQFHDESLDDDPNEPSTFVIPRPQVTGQFEMQRTNSDVALVEDDKSAAKFTDPVKPSAASGSDKEGLTGQENPSFLHSEGSQKEKRRRSKNPYEYF